MGELLRRYWHPIAAVAELDDTSTKPVRLMGEDLVLFRDGQGQIGLIVEAINVFDNANYRSYRTLYRVYNPDDPANGRLIDNFGTPDLGSADPGRRFQLGLDFRY